MSNTLKWSFQVMDEGAYVKKELKVHRTWSLERSHGMIQKFSFDSRYSVTKYMHMLFESGVTMVICYLPERSNWTIFFPNWFMNKSHLFLSGFKLLTLLFYAKLFMFNCFAVSDSIHSFLWWLMPLLICRSNFFLSGISKDKKMFILFITSIN